MKYWRGGGGVKLAIDWPPIQGGAVTLLVTSCYENQDVFPMDGPIGFCTGLTFGGTDLISKQSHEESSRLKSLKNFGYQLLVA